MSLIFGKTRAINFGRTFEDNPRLLTRNPYLNYLRYYKSQHPRYSLAQVLQLGSKTWRKMQPSQQKLFTQKSVLGSVPRSQLRLRGGPSYSTRVPSLRMPMKYKRRSMNAVRNVRNSRRKTSLLPKFGKRRQPGNLQLMEEALLEETFN